MDSGFGIRGYAYVRTEYRHGQVFFTIRQEGDTLRCSACGARDVRSRGHAERHFKSLPIGGKPVSIVFPIPRVECAVCHTLRQVEIGFADRRRSYTKSFERYTTNVRFLRLPRGFSGQMST